MGIRVPRYEGNVPMSPEAPAAQGGFESIERAGAGGQAVAQAGKDVMGVAGQVRRYAKNAGDYDALIEAKVTLEENLGQLRKQIKEQDPDAQEESFSQASKDHFEVLHQNLSPEVQPHFKEYWSKAHHSNLLGVTKEAWKQKASQLAANAAGQADRFATLAAEADNEFDRARLKGEYFGSIALAQEGLYLDPVKAEKMRQEFDPTVALKMAERDIREDPWLAKARLMDPAKHYPGMDDHTARSLRGGVQGEISRRQQDNAVEVDRMFEAGTLTAQGLQGMREGKLINLGTYRFYETAMRAGTDFKAVTDVNVYVPLLQQAMDGKMNPENVYPAVLAGRLKKEDGLRLLQVNESKGKGAEAEFGFMKNKYLKSSYDIVKDEVMDRLKPLEDTQKMQQLRLGKSEPLLINAAMSMFLDEIREAESEGKLTGVWMRQKGEEIIRLHEAKGAQFTARPKPKTWGEWWSGDKGGQAGTQAPTGTSSRSGPETVTKDGKVYRVLTVGGKKMVDPTPIR